MKFAIFLGCNIPARLKQYESSARAVLEKLGVELIEIKEFNCCGYPIRNIDFRASMLSAARNLALAETQGLNMMVLCKCGFGMLKKAHHSMKENASLGKELNNTLKKEGLEFKGNIEIKHLLSVLYHDVGLDAIKEKIARPYKELKIATHYGCHALRPSEIVQFDDPVNPTLFDKLVEATGAESIFWQSRLDCCGAPLLGTNDVLSMDLAEKKLMDAKQSGAHYLCNACPYCHIQFDTVQSIINSERGGNHLLPSILYPQLLGLSLGIDGAPLGLGTNQIDITSIEGFFSI
ncbi:MAG: CoB--CoM heterodisulfide reductase iron-sulfur subunit B family protein [Deltaproteobacteria bacterium]|nr:MAG: CoB--CoM heterodisulfide reductase iron-sulfur subunit B family protein [Deltaproteobacteria bacterium]